jgi:surface protein
MLFLREQLLLRTTSHGRILTATAILHCSLLFRKHFFAFLFSSEIPLLLCFRSSKPFDRNHCKSCILLVNPSVWLSFDLLKGYTSPRGSLACYTRLTDTNIRTAAQLWVSNQASATTTYGPVHLWDLSQVTSLANVWCGSDASSCGSAYVAMRSFNGDISMWDVSKVTTMYYTFLQASTFNGDTSKWDVAKVTTMNSSKSIRVM